MKSLRDNVRSGKLSQPFSVDQAKVACPGWGVRTYQDFFSKHRVGNPEGQTELFVRTERGRFRII
jgi:hypothetical protein